MSGFFSKLAILCCCWTITLAGDGPAHTKRTVNAHVQNSLKQAKADYGDGNYPEAMEGALEAYSHGQKTGDLAMLADAGNLIGLVDLAQGQTAAAIVYFRNAERINRKLGNQERVAANLLNISLAQSELQKLDSAVYYVRKSLTISSAHHIKNLIAMGRNHLGDYYFRQNKLAASEAEFMAVLTNKAYQDDWENSFANTGMARIMFSRKNFQQAALAADRAFTLAKAVNAKWDAAQALEVAHRAYRAAGNDKKAYDRLLAYKLYSDSLFNVESEKIIAQLRYKQKSVENDNLRKQVELARKQQKIDQLIIIVVLIASLLILFIAVVLYRRHRQMTRRNLMLKADHEASLHQNKIIEAQNEELNLMNRDNNRLLSIIAHDLRSPFAAIENTIAFFKSEGLSNEELTMLSEALSSQVSTASGMLNGLLMWAANQRGGMSYFPVEVDLQRKVDKVIDVYIAAARHKSITIEHLKADLPSVTGDADQIRIMIHNLISNSIKFTAESGHICIRYELKGNFLDLIIEDTGIGMSQEKLDNILAGRHEQTSTYGTGNEKGIGLGLHLVRDFAIKNGVHFLGETVINSGTQFRLRFNRLSYKEHS